VNYIKLRETGENARKTGVGMEEGTSKKTKEKQQVLHLKQITDQNQGYGELPKEIAGGEEGRCRKRRKRI